MDMIDDIFKNLDDWRHFPHYQLERRVDIFFSYFLRGLMQKKFGIEDPIVIPEFPINKNILYTTKDNQPKRIDYAVFDRLAIGTHPRVFLIELKTDMNSVLKKETEEQLNDMIRARDVGFRKVLSGIISTVKSGDGNKNNRQRRYAHLIWKLTEELRYLEEVTGFLDKWEQSRPGLAASYKQLSVSNEFVEPEIKLVLIMPTWPDRTEPIQRTLKKFTALTFSDIATHLQESDEYDSKFTETFVKYLRLWSQTKAGDKKPAIM